MFIAQWPAALVFPLFLVVGRGFVGAELGWLAIVGLLYAVFLVGALLIPPILSVIDGTVRTAGRTRLAYDVLSYVLWAGFLVGGVTAPDSSDAGHLRSAVTVWTNGAVSYEASEAVFAGAFVVIVIAWVALLGVSIAGIVRAARGR